MSIASPTQPSIVSPDADLRWPKAGMLALVGHSYCAYNSDVDLQFTTTSKQAQGARTFSRGVIERTLQLLGQPFTTLTNQGVAGLTSAQILANQIPVVLGMNPQPKAVWIHAISNDVFNAITPDVTINNCISMIQQLTQAGILVIFGGDYPRNGMSAPFTGQFAQAMNYLKAWCQKQPGVMYLDGYGCFADHSTLANSQTSTPDATRILNESGNLIHPNANGADKAAYNYAMQLRYFLFPADRRVDMGADGAGVNGDLQNGRNPTQCGTTGSFGTGSSGTLPTNFFAQRNAGAIVAVYDIRTRAQAAATFAGVGPRNVFDDNQNGNIIRGTLSASAADSDTTVLTITSGVSIPSGDGPYVAELEYGLNPTSGSITQFWTNVRDAAFTNQCATNITANGGDYAAIATKQTGVLRSRPFFRTATTNTLTLEFFIGTTNAGAAEFYVGKMRLEKLLF